MKGPRTRLDLDVRRVWQCPKCGRRRRIHANVVSMRCRCQPEGAWMQLVEEHPSDQSSTDPASGSAAPSEDRVDQTEVAGSDQPAGTAMSESEHSESSQAGGPAET